MPVWFPGKSCCSVCDEIVTSQQDVFAMPPYLADDGKHGPLSDSVVHTKCLRDHPDRDAILDRTRKDYRDSGIPLPDYFEPRVARMPTGD